MNQSTKGGEPISQKETQASHKGKKQSHGTSTPKKKEVEKETEEEKGEKEEEKEKKKDDVVL